MARSAQPAPSATTPPTELRSAQKVPSWPWGTTLAVTSANGTPATPPATALTVTVTSIIGSLVGGKVIDLYSIITLYKMMTLLAMVGIALFIAYYVWLQRKTNKTAQNHHEQAGT